MGHHPGTHWTCSRDPLHRPLDGEQHKQPTDSRAELRHAFFLPDKLNIHGKIDSELRYRGIFSIPVFRLLLAVEGEFPQPNFSDLGLGACLNNVYRQKSTC